MDSITERRSLSRRLRILVGTVVRILTVTVGFTLIKNNAFGSTYATWQADQSAMGLFNAATVLAPTLTRPCQFRPGLLGFGARVRIFWALPEDYTLDDVEVQASTSGLGSALARFPFFTNVRRPCRTTQLVDGPGCCRHRAAAATTVSGASRLRSLRSFATDRRTYSDSSSYRASKIGMFNSGRLASAGTRSDHGRYGRVPSLARRRT